MNEDQTNASPVGLELTPELLWDGHVYRLVRQQSNWYMFETIVGDGRHRWIICSSGESNGKLCIASPYRESRTYVQAANEEWESVIETNGACLTPITKPKIDYEQYKRPFWEIWDHHFWDGKKMCPLKPPFTTARD